MQSGQNLPETDPRHHTAKIKGMLNDLHQDIGKVNEPLAQALFETTLEVLKSLMNAYNHYEQHSEKAWK
jgi:uncharacterized protein YsxB (DUF464 family)